MDQNQCGDGLGRGAERRERIEEGMKGEKRGKEGGSLSFALGRKKKSRRLCLCERGTGGAAPIHHMAHGQRDVNNMI